MMIRVVGYASPKDLARRESPIHYIHHREAHDPGLRDPSPASECLDRLLRILAIDAFASAAMSHPSTNKLKGFGLRNPAQFSVVGHQDAEILRMKSGGLPKFRYLLTRKGDSV